MKVHHLTQAHSFPNRWIRSQIPNPPIVTCSQAREELVAARQALPAAQMPAGHCGSTSAPTAECGPSRGRQIACRLPPLHIGRRRRQLAPRPPSAAPARLPPAGQDSRRQELLNCYCFGSSVASLRWREERSSFTRKRCFWVSVIDDCVVLSLSIVLFGAFD